MARTGVKGGVIVSLFIIVFIFIFSGFAGSYVSINFPGDKNLGKFLSEEPLTADLNLTFDVPFPLGPDETMLTSKITYPDGRIYAEETIPLRPLLERYGVVYDGKYVYKPRFFDYDIRLTGKNVTYVGVPFSYTIQQTRVPPTDKGDRKWKVQGRHITDSTGTGAALLNTYCSGPWDFRDEGIGIGKLCDTSKTYCSAQPPNGNGDGECYVTCGAHLTQSSCEGEAQYDCNWVPGTGEEFCRIADITKCPILNGIETCSYTSEPLCEANAPCCGWAESGYCACADLPNGVCTAPEVSCPPSGRCCLPDNCCETAGANCADPNYCYCDGLGKVLAETYTRDDPTRPRAYCANMAFQSPGGTLTLRSNPNPGGAKIGIATGTCSENLATQTGTAPSGIICSYVPGGTHTCNNVPAGTLNAVVWHDDASDRATEIQVCQPTTGMAGESEIETKTISFATGDNVTIQRLAWDPASKAELNLQSILYFEDLDSKDVPDEPGVPLTADNLYCQTSHSWFFETYIYPSITKTASFKIYPDTGARVYLARADGNSWETVSRKTCLDGCDSELYKDKYSQGCYWTNVQFEKDTWYRLRIYLFNNPGGYCTQKDPPTGNPAGIRIIDVGTPEMSLLNEFGGETAVVNSESPGRTREINGSSRVSANEGLKEIVDVSAFSTEYSVSGSEGNVKLTMRRACGNTEYDESKYTDMYGWITDRVLPTYSWEVNGNKRTGYIKPFDEESVSATGNSRNLFRPDGENIGGVFKCMDKDKWPNWASECPNPRKYIDETHDRYCCRKTNLELDGDRGMITINNYEDFFSYIVNYLPASGSKLCAYTESYGSESSVNYVSEYRNAGDYLTNGNGVCTAPEVSCPPSGRCCLPDNCCETAGANCADPNYCYCDGLGKVLAETYTRDDPTRPRAYCANMAFQSPGGTLTLRSNPNPGGAKIGIATGTCSENLATQTGTAPSGIICSYVPGGTHTCNNVPAGTLNAVVWHDDASDRATEIQVCQPTTGMAGESEVEADMISFASSGYCDENSLQQCCYCTRDFGCTLGCLNRENQSGEYFPPPFDMSGPGWEIMDLDIQVVSYDPKVRFDVTGDPQNGWNLQARLDSVGDDSLYKNHTIPINLHDDFGFLTPKNTGIYDVLMTLNYGSNSETNDGSFEVVECLNPGEKSTYYDDQAYPATKNVGECRPGTRTCGSDNKWFYETRYDEPVYPGYEDCDGKDDDCNGIVDDIGGFDNIINEFIRSGGTKTPKQITKCGCFGGADPVDEICNNIDDDCDGTVDNSEKTVTVNTCDEVVIPCEEEGNPYTWCLQYYNSSTCSLEDVSFQIPTKLFVNTCTQSVKECLGNSRYNEVTGSYEPFTYDDCKHLYYGPNCLLEEIEVKSLGSTCYCSGGIDGDPSIVTETCNGVDDNCDGTIDDVEQVETCACAFKNINRTMFYKSQEDRSCDGIDSNCNGVIDDGASLCACRGRNPKDVLNIKLEGKDICDYLDNDCDGLVDEGFPDLGKPCGYGVCFGGSYVCNVYGDDEVCNTTVNPGETYLGNAFNYKTSEICDLKDNDCDGSIDEEDCLCTPSDIGISRICGYESGIYYRDRGDIDRICDQVMDQLSKLISWAGAPGNVFYRRLVIINNANSFDLENYPTRIILNTGELISNQKLRPDGGDLRIREREKEEHIDWINSNPFTSQSNTIRFRVSIPGNSEKHYYVYYGDPSATYQIPGETSILGLLKLRETLFLCHFDDTIQCEGNIIASQSSGISHPEGRYEKGVSLSSGGLLKYPTSENINKERGSIGFWVKPDNIVSEQYLFHVKDLNGDPQFNLYFDSGGTYFEVYDRNGNGNSVSGGSLDTEWNHVLVTWDVLQGIKLYVNGELEDSKTFSWQMYDLGMDMYVGSEGNQKQLEGVIDEFTIYSKAISAEEVRRDVRGYELSVSVGSEESLNQTMTTTTTTDIYLKCTEFLSNVTQTLTNESIMYTILSLCDSVRICEKEFPINSTSICMIGTQACSGGHWTGCSGVLPSTEVCNNRDDDCNGIVDDVANPEACACAYGGSPTQEECNGIDDNCNAMVDDVRGGDSKETTHCGCFGELVNITQKVMEPEKPDCNGIDDNCNGIIDEDVSRCACSYTVFTPALDNITTSKMPEDCDNIDDDCNGILDDPYQEGGSAVGNDNYLGADCGPMNSRCAGGEYVCSTDGTRTVCDTMSEDGLSGNDLRVPEICNTIDDDCNVVIDDVWGEDSGDYCQCYQGIPVSEEVCDGKDNNCDGLVDNVEKTKQCACFTDLQLNSTNAYEISVGIQSQKTSSETCNNVDDNCNRRIDEGLETSCFCSGGFSGNPRIRPEICNGADDDCDGMIDDVTFPETCSCYNGSHHKGELAETCDRADNNCNGLVDEEWPELGSACGFGICSGGFYECTTEGSNAVCSTIGGGNNKASTEDCDGIDNDCDLVIDEGCPCSPEDNRTCGIDVGICLKGYQACVNGQWSNCIGGKGPGTEICNAKDDNCDGVVDNVGGGNSPNSARCTCYAGASKADEVCDGMDNDCDGVVDNVYGGDSIESSKCSCYNGQAAPGANLEVCDGIDNDCDGTVDNLRGEMSVESTGCGCFGGSPKTDEICDGIDNDCDGTVDDDWFNVGETCGLGMCTGTYVCTEDGSSTVCSGGNPSPEVFDGRDNDCDGIVDNVKGEQMPVCGNGICETGETYENCPQDCEEGPPPVLPGTWILVFVAIIFIIVIVALALTFMK